MSRGINDPARKTLYLQELSCCYFYVKEQMPTEIGFQVWGLKSRELLVAFAGCWDLVAAGAVAGATRLLSRSATPHLRAGLMNGVAARLFSCRASCLAASRWRASRRLFTLALPA